MSNLLGPPPKIIFNGGGPNETELISLRPSQLVTGTWLILQFQNRASRQAPKRSLPTPSRSADDSHPQSIASSIEGPRPNRNDAFAPSASAHYQTDSSAQSQRAASAPPFRLDAEPYIKKDTSYTADNSFRSIFRENFDTYGTFPTDSTSTQQTDLPIAAESVTQGCRLLTLLSNRWVVNDFIDKWFEVCEGADDISIVGIVKGWLRKLWLCHGDVLESQDTDSMYRLSELLWRNTQAPLVFNGTTTAPEWIDLSTGPNIRWEVIGIIAAIVGICARYCEASHAIFQKHNVDRLILAKQATHVSNTCVTFTQKCAAVNDLLPWLLVEDHICSALVRGVHTYDSYRQTGEIVSTVVFLKWHQKIEANESVPHFLVEMRKRARASAYCAEIGNATFLGRPPRASYHYWDLDAPSDLTDSQLMQSNEEIESLLAQMDEHGYNRTGRLHRGTWYRVWLGFAQRREDVLDLALRNYTNDELLRKASDIERKSEEHWQRIPAWIREARHQKFNPTQNLLEQLYLTVIRHGTRGNELMLQRLLIRRKVATSEKLIQISQTIFKEVLEVGHSPDMVSKFQLDITSILVVHGLRAAIIIAAELFKQEQLPVYPKEPLLPRSQTIQDLSVFAARLGVVDPSDSMYDMSQDGRRMLIFVLDKILAPKPADQPVVVPQPCQGPLDHDQPQDQLQQQPPLAPHLGDGQMEVETASNSGVAYMPGMASAMPSDFGFGPPDWIINEDDSMFMQWLDSVDWVRQGPYVGL
ncbi:hypothetical protein PFICI_09571 [Pestalotiopsis fici W106-1]|uniref:Transcription factor domain-containing protein n=1 Tax=Pestalotiopsis fici (strain W106-1 / CGMCC3.15140) TaxID=1229662 RepID=W3X0R9_PESFW|nr:uncharacterized protein PFICI_09571 [Pestalotiopsis fici W106-1]ETS79718.1 hypothetical protein PFICI_09571 [Pestalotiopsis fici W106-1]